MVLAIIDSLLLCALGALLGCIAYSRWEWLSSGVHADVPMRIFGPRRARLLYMLLGVFLFLVGVYSVILTLRQV